jgi:hypothetical protein
MDRNPAKRTEPTVQFEPRSLAPSAVFLSQRFLFFLCLSCLLCVLCVMLHLLHLLHLCVRSLPKDALLPFPNLSHRLPEYRRVTEASGGDVPGLAM